MANRLCEWCRQPLAADRHPLALYCDQNCRKAASRARNPYVPAEPAPKPVVCEIDACQRRPYAKGLCEAHWKNLNRYGDPEASYSAAHIRARKRWGDATDSDCFRCGVRARDLAYQHTAGASELRTPKGSPFSMNPDDYRPMCGVCHSQLDRAHGGAQQGRRRDRPWVARGSRSPFPAEWRSGDFVRWTCAAGKRPIQTNGRPASTTDPSTWKHWHLVLMSRMGDGVGVMLGDGLGCYDLDHVSDEQAREFAASIEEPIVYVERSMSGDGVHIFVEAEPGPGSKRTVDGISVERYTRARFIRVTGETFKI